MFFSSKKKSSTVSIEKSNLTIGALRDNIANQEKREGYLEVKIQNLTAEAKDKKSKGDQKGALFALKKRKLYENELAKIENVKLTLESQAISLEGGTQNIETFQAMKKGTSAMKTIRKILGIDKVDQILDDVREEMELHQEVDNALMQPIDPYMADDEDLLAELRALEGEQTKTTAWPMSPSKPLKVENKPEIVASKPSRFALFS